MVMRLYTPRGLYSHIYRFIVRIDGGNVHIVGAGEAYWGVILFFGTLFSRLPSLRLYELHDEFHVERVCELED